MSRAGAPPESTGDRTVLVDPSKIVQRTSKGSSSPPPSRGSGERIWRPFAFQNLERVSQAHSLLTERLEWLVPSLQGGEGIGQAVQERLKGLFDAESDLLIDSVYVLAPKDLRRYLADPTFLATLAPLPHKTRGFVEVDLALAHAAIDLLLGGSGEAVALRPLTDIEEGVMGFVVLECLRALSPNIHPGLPRLRMEGLVHGVDEAINVLADEQAVAMVQFKCVIGQHSGYLRLFVPSTVLTLASPPDLAPEARARRRQRIERNVGRLSGVKTWLRAEIGSAEVLSSELAGLGKGDVVVTDGVSVRTDQKAGGTAELRVGMGRVGHIEAEILVEDGRYKAKLSKFVFGEPARQTGTSTPASGEGSTAGDEAPELLAEQGAPVVEESADESPRESLERSIVDETTLREGGELLNDIPLQVAVELARVPVTAEQVVALKVGQVIDLNRVPGEPVELSVNGKIVARGELVEVEGHLGVRIVSMVG